MKRISYLTILVCAVLFFESPAFAQSHIIFDVEMSPGSDFYHPILEDTYYKANTDMYMDVLVGNDGDAKNLAHQLAFVFYAKIDGIKTEGVAFNRVPVVPDFVTYWKDGGYTEDHSWHLNAIGALPITANFFATGMMGLLDTVVVRPGWADGTLPDTFAYAGAGQSGLPLSGLLPRLRFFFNVPVGGDDVVEICIDSSGYPAEDQYDWQFDKDANFGGPYCYMFAGIPDMVVDTDFLYFEADVDDILPDQQIITLQKTGEQDYLNWSAQKTSSWLSIIPSSGTMTNDPVTIQIVPVTTAFPSGIYYDTIDIIAPEAGNSPIRIPVEYKLLDQPPIIELSHENIIFNAVAGSSNPPDQILSINNIGFSDLNWTASNTESWLSLAPASGLNDGEVTLSIDITGLSYGLFYDSIVVSDPEADNSPQKAYVQLEISSDLPIIELDSTSIFVICNVPYAPDRKFNILNGGAGTMNYYLEESSHHVVGLSPKSGSVPQEVTVAFKTIGESGRDVYDTVWVYSDEAINSPQFVEFHFHFTDDPAIIGVDKSSFEVEYFECGQGVNLPTANPLILPILNIDDGWHEPFTFNITHTEDWLTLDKTTGDAPGSVLLSYEYRGLAPGIHYDTLHISAINAINSPVRIPVTMTILEAADPPIITESSVNLDFMNFAVQVNKYGFEYWYAVNNANPGCMDWEFSYLPPWLAVESDPETSYPWYMLFTPSGFGISRGIYYDEMRIESPTATNSPYIVDCKFSVFEFYGDTNFDGRITILDVVHIVNYLYRDGIPPQPITMTGDCNCDKKVNILDAIAIINYLYKDADPLCGNPY